MKLRLLAICGLILLACAKTPNDTQRLAEKWVDLYYAQIAPKAALAISKDEASVKLQQEIELLQGVGSAEESERPQTQFEVYPCKASSAELSECRYEIIIQDIRKRIRHGTLSLRKVEGSWWVINFLEDKYNE